MSNVLQTGDNVLGAVTFFAYIICALLLTGLIISDIAKRIVHGPLQATETQSEKKSTSQDHGQPKLKAIWMLIFAAIGFAQLSWNMLGVLVVSYRDWALRNGLVYPRGLVGEEDIVNVRAYVWCWATQSTLFRDFAEDLMRSDEIWGSVRLSLLWTMVGNVVASFYLCENYLTFPNLWAYCAVQQILPPSFAQNLFLATQFLVPPELAQGRPLRIQHVLTTLFATVVFISISVFARYLENSFGIFLILVMIRSLLVIPFLVSWRYQKSYRSEPQGSFAQQKTSESPSWAAISFHAAAVLLGLLKYDNTPSSFAERALVDDFQVLRLGLIGFVVLRCIDMRSAGLLNALLAIICARGMYINTSRSLS